MVLDYLCCDPIAVDDELDGFETSVASDSIGTRTDEGILECDYDTHVTELYHAIEERQWDDVLYFVEHNEWYRQRHGNGLGGLLFGGGNAPPAKEANSKSKSQSAHLSPVDHNSVPAIQARTWVTALDPTGHVRWCQLPLHAAVTFLAPIDVLRGLVRLYPKSVRCADDQDMLPLHYAFRFGADDASLSFLLEQFPQAVGKAAVQDRLPLDLAQYGPRPDRGVIIDRYMQSAVRNAKAEWDHEYERTVAAAAAAKTQRSRNDDESTQRELTRLRDELAETQRELDRTRRELALVQRENALDQREMELTVAAASASVTGDRAIARSPSKLRLRTSRSKSSQQSTAPSGMKRSSSKNNLLADEALGSAPRPEQSAPKASKQQQEEPPPKASSSKKSTPGRRKLKLFGKKSGK